MAQISCTRCGRPFSDAYTSCSWCGQRRSDRPAAPTQPVTPVLPPLSTEPAKPQAAPTPTSSPSPAPQNIAATGPTWTARTIHVTRWIIAHPRTSGASAIMIVFGWWMLIYLPASPSRALWNLASAVNHHRGEEAASYVDFESITRDLFNEDFKEQVAKDAGEGKNDPGTVLGEAIAKGLGGLMAGPLAETVKIRFEQEVADPAKGEHVTIFELIGALWHLQRTGDTAVTKGTDDRGQKVEVTLARGPTGWRITKISGDAVRKKLEEAARKSREGGTPGLPELPAAEPPKHEL